MPPPRASLYKVACRAVLNGTTQRYCVRKFAMRIASRGSEFFHGELLRLSVKHILCHKIQIFYLFSAT